MRSLASDFATTGKRRRITSLLIGSIRKASARGGGWCAVLVPVEDAALNGLKTYILLMAALPNGVEFWFKRPKSRESARFELFLPLFLVDKFRVDFLRVFVGQIGVGMELIFHRSNR